MYETFYNLRARPFQLSPDPRFFFSSKGHLKALSYLEYGIHQGEGFIVITGEIGAGKTMLVQTLTRKLESRDLVMGQVTNTQLEADDVIRMVAGAFGLPFENSKASLLRNLEHFLHQCHNSKKRALLLVDEAQNLPLKSLEELRMLSNFQRDGKALLQSFLLGQPEFRRTLQSPMLEQLRQRVIASCHLGPIAKEEIGAYITHRLGTAGWSGDPSFADDMFAAIYENTSGIPRKINLLCDRLLIMGRLDEKHALNASDVETVAAELREEFFPVTGGPTNLGVVNAR